MFKLISAVVAGAIVLAPLFPAQAGGFYRSNRSYRSNGYYRSNGFGVTIGSPSFGISIGNRARYRPFRNEVILRRSVYDPYTSVYPNSYYPGGVYSPGFPSAPVIVAPRARTVIVNPGYSNYGSSYCGSVIYGSPIASPIPVDPFTGLACR